jgi:hypothetical protein
MSEVPLYGSTVVPRSDALERLSYFRRDGGQSEFAPPPFLLQTSGEASIVKGWAWLCPTCEVRVRTGPPRAKTQVIYVDL